MDTSKLKRFAPECREQLLEQIGVKLDYVLTTRTPDLAEQESLVKALQAAIDAEGRAQVLDRVAYTWFNRFCALRFMDVNHYTRSGVVSPLEGHTQPEILADAKQGIFDPDLPVKREQIRALLNGNIPSRDPQGEAYRLLLVAACQQSRWSSGRWLLPAASPGAIPEARVR